MWWMMTTVLAAPQLDVFGKPFEPVSAWGVPNAQAPGMLTVMWMDIPITCEQARDIRDPEVRAFLKEKQPTVVLASFDSAQAEARSLEVVVAQGERMAIDFGAATLLGAASAANSKGRIRLDIDAKDPSDKKRVRVKGELDFELCFDVGSRPSLEGTKFVDQTIAVEHFEGDVKAKLPSGWAPGHGPFKESWLAPDGRTLFDIGVATSQDQVEEAAKSQAAAFQGEGNTGELVRSEAIGEQTYVVHWRHRYESGPWTNHLEVSRYRADGEGVRCKVQGDDTAVAQVFEAVEKACRALEL